MRTAILQRVTPELAQVATGLDGGRGPVAHGHRGRAAGDARPTPDPPLGRAAIPPARPRVPRGAARCEHRSRRRSRAARRRRPMGGADGLANRVPSLRRRRAMVRPPAGPEPPPRDDRGIRRVRRRRATTLCCCPMPHGRRRPTSCFRGRPVPTATSNLLPNTPRQRCELAPTSDVVVANQLRAAMLEGHYEEAVEIATGLADSATSTLIRDVAIATHAFLLSSVDGSLIRAIETCERLALVGRGNGLAQFEGVGWLNAALANLAAGRLRRAAECAAMSMDALARRPQALRWYRLASLAPRRWPCRRPPGGQGEVRCRASRSWQRDARRVSG